MANTGDLPTARTGATLEWPDDIGGNPAAVKAARLGDDFLVADVAGFHELGVESEVILQVFVGGWWGGVGPGGVHGRVARYHHIVIMCRPLKLAKRFARRRPQVSHVYSFWWEIIDRWVAGFQQAIAVVGLGNDLPIKDDFERFRGAF